VELHSGLQKRRLHLVDLPGYGYAKVSKAESESLRRMLSCYLQRGPCLQVVVWLIDVKVGLTAADMQVLELLEKSPARLLLVATKTDKLKKTQRKAQLEKIASALELPMEAVFAVSSKEKWGIGLIWENILQSLSQGISFK
jgi:GTP-binding protein